MSRRRLLVVASFGGLLVVVLASLGSFLRSPAASRSFTPQPLGRIRPGTSIPDQAPEGWTHLIYKTHSELSTGDVDKLLKDFAKPLAEFLFTAMVARVCPTKRGDRRSYRLDGVAIGVGTRVGKQHVIISSQTQGTLGANLGPLKQVVLARAEERLDKVFQVARSETMIIVDALSIMLCEGRHRDVVLRYVFLVHPDDGRLASVVWRVDIDQAGNYRPAATPAVWVRPNLVRTSPLHVDGNEVTLGLPSGRAFALTQLPPGTPFSMPASLRALAGSRHLTVKMAGQIETALRQALGLPVPR